MANKYMKICSPSLVIRDFQIKTKMRYLYIPIKIVKIPKQALSVAGGSENGGIRPEAPLP